MDAGADGRRGGWGPALVLGALGALAIAAVLPFRDEAARPGEEPSWVVGAGVLFWGLAVVVALASARRGPAPAGEPQVEVHLCQHCALPHAVGAHFCPRCAAPLTVFANTAPYESVYAQMWGLGKAARHPQGFLHVVGLVLVVGPWLAPSLAMISELVLGEPTMDAGHPALGAATWLLLAILAAIAAVLVYLAVRNRLRALDGRPSPAESGYGHPPWWTRDVDWPVLGAADEAEGEPLEEGVLPDEEGVLPDEEGVEEG